MGGEGGGMEVVGSDHGWTIAGGERACQRDGGNRYAYSMDITIFSPYAVVNSGCVNSLESVTLADEFERNTASLTQNWKTGVILVSPRLVAKIESEEPTLRLAVLIDADNAQAAVSMDFSRRLQGLGKQL